MDEKTLRLLKRHLRADDCQSEVEDEYLEFLWNVGKEHVHDYIGRTEEEVTMLNSGEYPCTLMNAAFEVASHIYENPGATAQSYSPTAAYLNAVKRWEKLSDRES